MCRTGLGEGELSVKKHMKPTMNWGKDVQRQEEETKKQGQTKHRKHFNTPWRAAGKNSTHALRKNICKEDGKGRWYSYLNF